MAIYTLTPQQLKGAGIYNSFEVPAGGGVPSFNEYSFQFDGVDDYIDCGLNANLSFGNTSSDFPFTFSMWVKVDDLSTSHGLIKRGDFSTTNNREQVFYIASDGSIANQIYSNGQSLNRRGRKTSTGLISPNTWYHIVWTYNGNSDYSGIKIYLDGVRVDNANNGKNTYVAMKNTGFPFKIGEFINGNIDEVAVFNSELSTSDITTIYNSGVPNDISGLSPLSWWRMGEAATFDGIRDWNLVDQGTGGNDAVTQNIAETERVTDVPTASSFTNIKSIELDGIDDFVNCGEVTQIQNTNSLSVSCWFNYKILGASVNGIVSKDSITRSDGNWYISTQNATIRFLLKTANGQDALNSGTISLNSWNNLLCVWNGLTMKIYINGILDNSISLSNATGTLGLRTTDVKIGRRLVGSFADGFFNGGVDEVAVWNSDESANASTIYNSGVPNDISSLSPVSWWRCGDSDISPTLTDNGSGGNDGTMTNFTTFSTDVPT